jgi:AraC family transcriptional regulator
MSRKLYAERMNKVVHFIENNLDSNVDCDKLAEISCYSKFHFHRLFYSYIGEGVYAFRKRLLLERSIRHLLYSDDSIIDIAFKCGYENQASFNKAFRKQFSFTPSQVRKQMVSVDTSRVKLTRKRSVNMKPEIVEFEEIKVISARAFGAYAEAAPEAWSQIMKFAYSNKLMKNGVRMFGISHDDPNVTEPNNIRYDACVDIDANIEKEANLRKLTVSGGTYARFLHKGPYENFQETYAYIFNEWLPESNHKLRDVPCFEIYLNKDPRRTKPENLKTEIHIPIE